MSAPKAEAIARLVHAVRGERVLFDADLADLYGVTAEDCAILRSQIVTSGSSSTAMRSQIVTATKRNDGTPPYAFTEQGVAMLSSVLRSPRAVEVNIAIMRTFVELRRRMDSNRLLARKIEAMERKYDEQFSVVFDAIKRLIAEEDSRRASPKRRIGFIA
jgi:hypothetical protein